MSIPTSIAVDEIEYNGTSVPVGGNRVISTENQDGTQNLAIVDGGTVVISSENQDGTQNLSIIDGEASVSLQAKTATANGVVTPDSGYDGLSQVLVAIQGVVSGMVQGSEESSLTIQAAIGRSNIFIYTNIDEYQDGFVTHFLKIGDVCDVLSCYLDNDYWCFWSIVGGGYTASWDQNAGIATINDISEKFHSGTFYYVAW